MKLTQGQIAIVRRAAKADGLTPEAMIRMILMREDFKLQEKVRRERAIVSFSEALRRCGIEPDDFEDDRELWESQGGPVVRFRKPRPASHNGITHVYRVADVRRALGRWTVERNAAMSAEEASLSLP